MPASSADSFDPIEQTLQESLNGPSTTNNETHVSLEDKLAITSKRVLLTKIDFQPADTSYSFTLKTLKSKYIHLNPDGRSVNKSNSEMNGNSHAHTSVPEGDGIPHPKVMIHPPDKVTLGWQRVYRIGAGLLNMGNTCFLNATLQCLTYTPPLVNHLIEFDEHSANCKTVGFCMMCELFRHIRRALEKNGDVIKPNCILSKLKAIAKHMVWGRQEDAHEFLRYVMESMIKSSLKGYSSNTLDRISLETTVVNHIFGGYHRSQVICLRCKSKSDTYDHFMDIILDIKNVPSLEQALEKFIKPEILDNENAYMCPRCMKKCPAQKRFTIHRAPNIATFQLKRFDYNRMIGGKITKNISFPEKLDLRPYMSQQQSAPVRFQLYAVLVHQGASCNSGHYFCFVRNSNNLWYCMDDCRIRQVSLNFVLSQQAYLLFYTRVPNNPTYVSKPPTQNSTTVIHSQTNSVVVNGNHEPHHPTQATAVNNIKKPTVLMTNNGKLKCSSPVISSANSNLKPQNFNSAGQMSPLPTCREKVSFDIKLQNKASDVDPKRKRIVMQIKNGKATSSLVPYAQDSSEDSDQESGRSQSQLVNGVKKEEIIKEESFNLPSAEEPEKKKIKATSSWTVTNGNGMSLNESSSSSSGSSSNNINSTTDWRVTVDSESIKTERSPAIKLGWLVTNEKEDRLPKLLGGKEKRIGCCDDQSLSRQRKNRPKESSRCHSDTETHVPHRNKVVYGNLVTCKDDQTVARTASEQLPCGPRLPGSAELVGCVSRKGNDQECVAAQTEKVSNDPRVPELGTNNGHCSSDSNSNLIGGKYQSNCSETNGHKVDSVDDEVCSVRKKRKKHKRDHRNATEENGTTSSKDDSPHNHSKRKKKHARHEINNNMYSDHSSEESSKSYDLVWVERTKETVEKERQQDNAPAHHWTESSREKNVTKFNNHNSNGKHHSNNGVIEYLNNNSFHGYGSNVKSWNGEKNSLDKSGIGLSRKRHYSDDYDDEYDRGRMKKSRKQKFSKRPYNSDKRCNLFQQCQNSKNNYKFRQDRMPFNSSFPKKQYHHYNNNSHLRKNRHYDNKSNFNYHNNKWRGKTK